MPDILIRCPILGMVVRTGLNTDMVKFSSLAEVPFSVVCKACGKTHRWKQRQAWIEIEANISTGAEKKLSTSQSTEA